MRLKLTSVCSVKHLSDLQSPPISDLPLPDHALRKPIAVFSLAMTAVLLAIDLIGVNRRETIRLWIFLACFFQIPAAR